tara:strand:- start:2828 stop:3493 length:666 start_codon:yes stop_codon:yes gene_type:complete
MINKKKIFIAVDTNKVSLAKKIIKDTQTNKIKVGYKFGLEFMNSKNGRRFISTLRNKIIFIDLKLKDTVNTMVSAVKALKDLKIDYLTVHISSGLAALKAVKKVSGRTKIIGVTTLTSLNDNDLKLIGYNKTVKSLVIHQAKLAKKASIDALVCSPYEVSSLRKIFKKEIITPGVQIGKKNYDQKRSMEAKKVQSDWIVIGRAITRGNVKKNIQNLAKELR